MYYIVHSSCLFVLNVVLLSSKLMVRFFGLSSFFLRRLLTNLTLFIMWIRILVCFCRSRRLELDATQRIACETRCVAFHHSRRFIISSHPIYRRDWRPIFHFRSVIIPKINYTDAEDGRITCSQQWDDTTLWYSPTVRRQQVRYWRWAASKFSVSFLALTLSKYFQRISAIKRNVRLITTAPISFNKNNITRSLY